MPQIPRAFCGLCLVASVAFAGQIPEVEEGVAHVAPASPAIQSLLHLIAEHEAKLVSLRHDYVQNLNRRAQFSCAAALALSLSGPLLYIEEVRLRRAYSAVEAERNAVRAALRESIGNALDLGPTLALRRTVTEFRGVRRELLRVRDDLRGAIGSLQGSWFGEGRAAALISRVQSQLGALRPRYGELIRTREIFHVDLSDSVEFLDQQIIDNAGLPNRPDVPSEDIELLRTGLGCVELLVRLTDERAEFYRRTREDYITHVLEEFVRRVPAPEKVYASH